MQRLIACCKAVDAYAREKGVGTLYEVCNHYQVPLIHTAAQCRDLMREVGSSNLRMILDSFHMNIDEQNPLQALRENARDLVSYHIPDSARGGIGSGHTDFKAQHDVLIARGFTGEIAIKPVLPSLTPSTAPSIDDDKRVLDGEITRSVSEWNGYARALL